MKKMVIGTGLLLAAAAAAGAQVAPNPPVQARDGVQTRAEVVERARTMFARVDSDRDGYLSRADREARGAELRSRLAARAADPARQEAMFNRVDTNRDNVISREEFAKAQAFLAERGARAAALRAERAGERGQRAARQAVMLRSADTDRDQRISLAEFEAAALQRFDRADLNRDGRITQEERQQRRQQWQQQRGAATPVR